MSTQDFVSIDFETMTVKRTSACAVGLAVVLDGIIHRKFYSLIKPIPDDEQRTNTFVHGITPEMVQFAPTFEMLWPTLANFLGELPIVCHNRNTDINILRDCMAYYGLSGIDVDNNICTYELTGQPLEACCAKFGINMGSHHDALDDAVACARVFLALQGNVMAAAGAGSLRHIMADKSNRSYERATLDPLADDQVEDKSTPFYHAAVVITGTFDAYPNRNELGKLLQSLGADINTAISSKTDVVVIGHGAGPSKLKKIKELHDKGHEIRMIFEPELVQLLNKQD